MYPLLTEAPRLNPVVDSGYLVTMAEFIPTSESDPVPSGLKQESPSAKGRNRRWVVGLLLVLVLATGAYLRTAGLYWGEYQYLHPDERFLVWVGTDISPTKLVSTTDPATQEEKLETVWISPGEYFDTKNSTLNPNNRGHGFYVYGTLPMFTTRVVVELIYGRSGFDVMTQVGRALSAIADLLSVLLAYFIGARLYNRWTGLLAAAFSAFAVLQIQQSHFFTMDTFANFFTYLAIYFAIRIATDRVAEPARVSLSQSIDSSEEVSTWIEPPAKTRWEVVREVFRQPLLWESVGFGLAYGAAMASKISIVPLAILLPIAVAIRILRQPRADWNRLAGQALVYLAVAGALSLLVFRLAQPYAFSGPGFFGVKLNPEWLRQVREQRNQATIEVDFPPAMQWARRPIWFSFQNLTAWGLGLPLGILAWLGFLWAGWEILKGDRKHLLLWLWTGAFFAWQSLPINPTMRYQLPIYPALAIFAAWGVVHLWETGKARRVLATNWLPGARRIGFSWQQPLAIGAGITALLLTMGYAFAFSSIYTRPITRIAASRWIYQNIPGPINLHIQTAQGRFNQPLPFPYNGSIMAGMPYSVGFNPGETGQLSEIYFPFARNLTLAERSDSLIVSILGPDGATLATTNLAINPGPVQQGEKGKSYTVRFDPPIQLAKGQGYQLRLEAIGEAPSLLLNTSASLRFIDENGQSSDYPAFSDLAAGWQGLAANSQFASQLNGLLTEVFQPAGDQPVNTTEPLMLLVTVKTSDNEPIPLTQTVTAEPVLLDDGRGPGYRFKLSEPIYLVGGQKVELSLAIREDQAAFNFTGAGLANEGEWDDGLPVRLDGYDPFGGIYPLELNFNMYWDDTAEKLARFTRILDESDWIAISSNRQWGSLTRIPERFPMTTLYYRSLLGCPPEKDIVWCYRVAEPGMFQGGLGFELVRVEQSDPAIGALRINDQFAEEAFTVYDHPKVLIFKKTAAYDSQQVSDLLGSVDFNKVIRLAPLKFSSYPADLLLPVERWIEQQRGGTWAELFNPSALLNRNQWAASIAWYLSLMLLGWLVYPLVRMALPGLADRGYPLARIAGLLILSYLAWLAGSLHNPSNWLKIFTFTRPVISVILLVMAASSVWLAIKQRQELASQWRDNKSYYLMIEGLFLAFFLVGLLIRIGNPDLWHPYKGGEKPMDFAYFNAILKSSSFPPYDPWFAGGYLNYYYYGFVLVGTLVKWLGITPAVAYNLILPTMFALIGLGAFSIAWNLYQGSRPDSDAKRVKPFLVGLAGALGMAVLGNLGTVKMIYEGFQRLAAPAGVIEDATLWTRLGWAFQGFLRNLAGSPLPYGIGDWYWNPSRAIPAPGEVEPITEFPFFTVLYADPHAHLYSLALTLLSLGFGLSVLLSGARWKTRGGAVLGFVLGGLAIGALRPTNTWDFYPYLALVVTALAYSLWKNYRPQPVQDTNSLQASFEGNPVSRDEQHGIWGIWNSLPAVAQRSVITLSGVGLLVILSLVLYQPFAQWYGLGYSKIDLWQGLRTPLKSYLVHWGLFLFVITSWLAWETRDWMAKTPFSRLRLLEPYRGFIFGVIGFLLLLTLSLAIKLPGASDTPFGNGVTVAWLALPLAAWAGILILRPDQPDAKRFTLFMIGTGLTLTLMVEVIVLVGDIARMNTVFKFYLQVWTLFAICAAAALGWLLSSILEWTPGWRNTWSILFVLLVGGAALYPLTAGRAKILDRMSEPAPHNLDGMAYMDYASYDWMGVMDLSEDARAIRWMQENVAGSPVIVEANLRDLYRWGSRISIYTGLPGVVGWEWHQQQQRALTPGVWVSERIVEIDNFYTTSDPASAAGFLAKYNVKYIVVGQLERNVYPAPGLEKFPALEGSLWKAVYQDGSTIIYQVSE